MIRIDCDTADIPVQLPRCAGTINSAYIFRPHGVRRELTATLDPALPGIVRLSNLPADAPRGVYTLALQSNCGCFTTSVAVDCPAPALPGTHNPTNPPGITKVCCSGGPDSEPPGSSGSHVTDIQPVIE